MANTIDSRVKGIGNSIKFNQHLLTMCVWEFLTLMVLNRVKVKKKVRKKINWKQEKVSATGP